MADKKSKTKKVPAPAFVSADEFKKFQEEVRGGTDLILQQLEKMSSPVVTGKEVQKETTVAKVVGREVKDEEATPEYSNDILLPHYQKVFEKYFDPADGFTARMSFPTLDEKGNENGGITFTISVPLKFSNTDDGYRKMYKQDLRTRALLPHNIGKGIEDWCKAVAKNLNYNVNVKTK